MSAAVQRAIRETRRQGRPPRKVCPYCFERDHIAGRNHVPHIVVDTCQYHHALRTEERIDAEAEMGRQANTIRSMVMALRSLAVTVRAMSVALIKCAELIEFCASRLLKNARDSHERGR